MNDEVFPGNFGCNDIIKENSKIHLTNIFIMFLIALRIPAQCFFSRRMCFICKNPLLPR